MRGAQRGARLEAGESLEKRGPWGLGGPRGSTGWSAGRAGGVAERAGPWWAPWGATRVRDPPPPRSCAALPVAVETAGRWARSWLPCRRGCFSRGVAPPGTSPPPRSRTGTGGGHAPTRTDPGRHLGEGLLGYRGPPATRRGCRTRGCVGMRPGPHSVPLRQFGTGLVEPRKGVEMPQELGRYGVSAVLGCWRPKDPSSPLYTPPGLGWALHPSDSFPPSGHWGSGGELGSPAEAPLLLHRLSLCLR